MDRSDWASPAVHVSKPNDKVRVCGDDVVVNEVIDGDGYKLPNIQDLFSKDTQNGTQPKFFSKLDLTGAFNQWFLDEDSAQVMAVLSHKLKDGSERPIVSTSKTLSAVKKNYEQIENEGLAIVYDIKKFHLYFLAGISGC